jgi:hypothetical protein
MAFHYWAVKPADMELKFVRIERAEFPRVAVALAFGRPFHSPKYEVGRWSVKDLGTRVSVIQSDNKRIRLLEDKSGWFDPYEGERDD